jgi:hypothetical protein
VSRYEAARLLRTRLRHLTDEPDGRRLSALRRLVVIRDRLPVLRDHVAHRRAAAAAQMVDLLEADLQQAIINLQSDPLSEENIFEEMFRWAQCLPTVAGIPNVDKAENALRGVAAIVRAYEVAAAKALSDAEGEGVDDDEEEEQLDDDDEEE